MKFANKVLSILLVAALLAGVVPTVGLQLKAAAGSEVDGVVFYMDHPIYGHRADEVDGIASYEIYSKYLSSSGDGPRYDTDQSYTTNVGLEILDVRLYVDSSDKEVGEELIGVPLEGFINTSIRAEIDWTTADGYHFGDNSSVKVGSYLYSDLGFTTKNVSVDGASSNTEWVTAADGTKYLTTTTVVRPKTFDLYYKEVTKIELRQDMPAITPVGKMHDVTEANTFYSNSLLYFTASKDVAGVFSGWDVSFTYEDGTTGKPATSDEVGSENYQTAEKRLCLRIPANVKTASVKPIYVRVSMDQMRVDGAASMVTSGVHYMGYMQAVASHEVEVDFVIAQTLFDQGYDVRFIVNEELKSRRGDNRNESETVWQDSFRFDLNDENITLNTEASNNSQKTYTYTFHNVGGYHYDFWDATVKMQLLDQNDNVVGEQEEKIRVSFDRAYSGRYGIQDFYLNGFSRKDDRGEDYDYSWQTWQANIATRIAVAYTGAKSLPPLRFLGDNVTEMDTVCEIIYDGQEMGITYGYDYDLNWDRAIATTSFIGEPEDVVQIKMSLYTKYYDSEKQEWCVSTVPYDCLDLKVTYSDGYVSKGVGSHVITGLSVDGEYYPTEDTDLILAHKDQSHRITLDFTVPQLAPGYKMRMTMKNGNYTTVLHNGQEIFGDIFSGVANYSGTYSYDVTGTTAKRGVTEILVYLTDPEGNDVGDPIDEIVFYMQFHEGIATIDINKGKAEVDGTEVSYVEPGTEVTLTANEPPSDEIFMRWKIVDADGNVESIWQTNPAYYTVSKDVTITAEYTEPYHVTEIRLNDIDDPVAGEHPDYRITIPANYRDYETYNSTTAKEVYNGVQWYDETDGKVMTPTDVFEAGHEYSVNVYVKANDGNIFVRNDEEYGTTTGYINDLEASYTSYNGEYWRRVGYIFPAAEEPSGATLYGTITSAGDEGTNVIAKLYDLDGNLICDDYERGCDVEYKMRHLPAGEFVLEVKKNGHATVTKNVTIAEGESKSLDVILSLDGSYDLNQLNFTLSGYEVGAKMSDMSVKSATAGAGVYAAYGESGYSIYTDDNGTYGTRIDYGTFDANTTYWVRVKFSLNSGYNVVNLIKRGITLDGVPAEEYFVGSKVVYFKLEPLTETDGDDGLLGDVTLDGTVNMMDALMVYSNASGGVSLTEEQKKYADQNSDGDINMMDALLLYMKVSS